MSNPAIAYLTYMGVLVSMLLIGGAMQAADTHWGLILSQVVCILIPALVLRAKTRQRASQPTFTELRLDVRMGLWVVVTAAVIGLAANSATGLLAELVPVLGKFAEAYDEMFQALLYPGDPILRAAAIVAVVVVAPLCEETLFRGGLLPLQRTPERSVAATVALNGLLFSVLHVNPVGFFALIAIGAFFAHLAILTGSIWPSILAHATLNLVNGVLLPEVLRASGIAEDPSLPDYLVTAGLLVPAAAALWFFGTRSLGSGKPNA